MITDLEVKKSILIVDDEQSIRSLLTRLLTGHNYTVHSTDAADAALRILEDHAVDLVISDITMPNKSGLELLAEIKAASNIPVIMVTGQGSVQCAVNCIKHGAAEYVMKPFAIDELLEKVETVLAAPVPIEGTMAMDQVSARAIAGYEIVRILGEGNMGTVYLVNGKAGQAFGDQLAIKVLKTESMAEDQRDMCFKRFINEAKAVSSLMHPNIVSIVEYGSCEREKIPFMVMEYARGKSLKDYIVDGDDLSYVQKTLVLRQVADALSAIHAREICHRDIKPANIIVDKSLTVKLTDFGIAHLPGSELTLTANIIGTPTYMSPEAFVSAKVDERSDIFSLGSVAYEFLLGRKPFVGDNMRALVKAIQTAKPTEPCKVDADFPPKLQRILAKMLKKSPQQRYDTASDLVAEFDDYLNDASAGVGASIKRLIGSLSIPDWC